MHSKVKVLTFCLMVTWYQIYYAQPTFGVIIQNKDLRFRSLVFDDFQFVMNGGKKKYIFLLWLLLVAIGKDYQVLFVVGCRQSVLLFSSLYSDLISFGISLRWWHMVLTMVKWWSISHSPKLTEVKYQSLAISQR